MAQDAAQDVAQDAAQDAAQDVAQDLVHTTSGGAAQSASMFISRTNKQVGDMGRAGALRKGREMGLGSWGHIKDQQVTGHG